MRYHKTSLLYNVLINIFTARIRRMGEGTVFSLSVHTQGGVPGPGPGRGGPRSRSRWGESQVQVKVGGYPVSDLGGWVPGLRSR